MPQSRGEVSAEMAAKLRDAHEGVARAQEHYEQTVLEALRAGGSYREIAWAVGLHNSAISKLANRLGWPTPEMKEQRERERQENLELRARVRAEMEAQRRSR